MAIIHVLNNLNLYFWPFFAILSYDAREKEKFSTLSKLTKALKNEQMHFWNKNKGIANDTHSYKPKKDKPNKQKKKEE